MTKISFIGLISTINALKLAVLAVPSFKNLELLFLSQCFLKHGKPR